MKYFQISQRESLLVGPIQLSSVWKQPLNNSPSTYSSSKFAIVTHYESTGISQHKSLATVFLKSPTSFPPVFSRKGDTCFETFSLKMYATISHELIRKQLTQILYSNNQSGNGYHSWPPPPKKSPSSVWFLLTTGEKWKLIQGTIDCPGLLKMICQLRPNLIVTIHLFNVICQDLLPSISSVGLKGKAGLLGAIHRDPETLLPFSPCTQNHLEAGTPPAPFPNLQLPVSSCYTDYPGSFMTHHIPPSSPPK